MQELAQIEYDSNYLNDNVLFPDQVVYFNITNPTVGQTSVYEEILYAYKFILKTIAQCQLTPNFISKEKANLLLDMESEKYRQNILKNSV